MIDPASRAKPTHPSPLALHLRDRLHRYKAGHPAPATTSQAWADFDREEAHAERTSDRSWAR